MEFIKRLSYRVELLRRRVAHATECRVALFSFVAAWCRVGHS
jgi:hypothetical protein